MSVKIKKMSGLRESFRRARSMRREKMIYADDLD